MAKKAQKGKPAKKAAQPAKKAAPKKAAPKKAAKPAKKAIAKKPVKKVVPKNVAPKKAAKPVKKTIAKKPVKKVAPKKVAKAVKKAVAKKVIKKVLAKKVAPKKIVKTSKKVIAKKIVKPSKKVVAKKTGKLAEKVVAKPVQKITVKPIAKSAAKAITKIEPPKVVLAKPLPIVPIVKKATPVSKKKQNANFDLDDESREEESLVVEYKTPSILRPMGPIPTPHVNLDKRTRYTDAELKEFKELILKKLAEAQKDYELLKSTLSHKDDHGTDDTSPTFKLLEDGSDVLSKEETSHLAGRQEKFIQNLQNALIRIENKTYGICRVTGKLISKERLRSVPHATLVIEAKLGQNV